MGRLSARARRTFRIRKDLQLRLDAAAAALERAPGTLWYGKPVSVSVIVEAAIEGELSLLEGLHHGGKPWPRARRALRTGRPPGLAVKRNHGGAARGAPARS